MASTDTRLVNEIWDNICSFLTPPSLSNLRLASHRLDKIALPWKYRSLRLEAFAPESIERFIQIAKTPNLRSLVREITIDTRIEFDFEYLCNDSYIFPTAFMNALPHLRCFTNVTALHIRFEEHCGEDDRYSQTIEETWEFRYRVLDTILHCAAGLWTLEKQLAIDEKMEGYLYLEEDNGFDYSDQDLDFAHDKPFPLKELTITHLADYDDYNITHSEAWKKIISLPTLVDLRIFVTTEECEASPESTIHYIEKYDFFDNLHNTWLSPSISERLRVLSLYFKDYWGWFPIMDFRNIKGDTPFPQLKVLALGNYVFTHDWQIDWFAKVGKENGSGGLEELYLDDCPILYHARQLSIGSDGYADHGAHTEQHGTGREWNPIKRDFPIRWHNILSQWKDTMKGLKVLRMGHGCWWDSPKDTLHTLMQDPDYKDLDQHVLGHRLSRNQHRNFACPAPAEEESEESEEIWRSGKYRNGTGIDAERASRMQYIEYNCGLGPSAWLEKNGSWDRNDDGFAPEEGTLEVDNAAWEGIMAVIKARQRGVAV
ncbi:hypothetical protein FBEOM_8376 [Fusarium beomiforme]|uniref:F-box domain-containing protein n=1 Tax=Fusarium beomiforme TaxID=44412 RepID=A0A9P5AFI1_9HYPO|nr:hypothetical protein FBEOM_8376 [Fusarium beomiforme]